MMETVKAIASYAATDADQIDLEIGDVLRVSRKSPNNDWWYGKQISRQDRAEEEEGWFPASYIVITEEADSQTFNDSAAVVSLATRSPQIVDNSHVNRFKAQNSNASGKPPISPKPKFIPSAKSSPNTGFGNSQTANLVRQNCANETNRNKSLTYFEFPPNSAKTMTAASNSDSSPSKMKIIGKSTLQQRINDPNFYRQLSSPHSPSPSAPSTRPPNITGTFDSELKNFVKNRTRIEQPNNHHRQQGNAKFGRSISMRSNEINDEDFDEWDDGEDEDDENGSRIDEGKYAVAIGTFDAPDSEYLSLKIGDLILVTDRSTDANGGWWRGRPKDENISKNENNQNKQNNKQQNHSENKWFPASYVKSLGKEYCAHLAENSKYESFGNGKKAANSTLRSSRSFREIPARKTTSPTKSTSNTRWFL